MTFTVVSDAFFAPVDMDLVDQLVASYASSKETLLDLSERMSQPPYAGVIPYYLEAASSDHHRFSLRHIDNLFDAENALKALDADYWSKALNLTDVLDLMPQKKRNEWLELLQEMNTPAFEEETVRATLTDLISQRARFFSERVDGIFQALSREHVTNCPEGFGKRMILYYMIDRHGFTCTNGTGHINDLRAVIAKLQGRDEPNWQASHKLIRALISRTGQWFDIDGGALRIRLYKKGTAHIEVHPDIAWRLNQILAYIHPAAIPSHFRNRPKRHSKVHRVLQTPLPYSVTELLSEITRARREGFYFQLPYSAHGCATVRARTLQVLESIGGVRVERGNMVKFDYDAGAVIDEIAISGCIPDQQSHQFYPTPDGLAQRVVELAQIGLEHRCLEPQAGQGGIAAHMPQERTTCVEISALHCEVLSAKGFDPIKADFLSWAKEQPMRFDRIVMNPPFNMGRWEQHLEAALPLLAPKGKLVAILPSSARHRSNLAGYSCTWNGPYSGEFPGVSIDVVILVADKA